GGQRCAAVHRHRVTPVLLLDFAQPARGEAQRLVPSCRAETRVGAQQRIEQAVGMAALQVPLHALRTQHAVVERKILPRFESDHAVGAHLELNAALLPAEAAVSLNEFIGWIPRFVAPTAWRDIVEMRTVTVDELVDRRRRFSHATPPESSFVPPKESCACTPGTAPASARPGRKLHNQNRAGAGRRADPPRAAATRNARRS